MPLDAMVKSSKWSFTQMAMGKGSNNNRIWGDKSLVDLWMNVCEGLVTGDKGTETTLEKEQDKL